MHVEWEIYVASRDASARAALLASLTALRRTARDFASPSLAFERAVADRPACLLLDVGDDAERGLALQRDLASRAPCVPVVFVATAIELRTAVRAMHDGAVDVLLRPFAAAELAQAIDEALRQHRSRLARRIEAGRDAARYARLTPREREVFRLLAQGLRNRQVADALQGSEATVKVHRSRLMRKLGLRSPVELIALARRLSDNRTVIP